MIITQKTPNILFTLEKLYKQANENGKAYQTIRDVIYHNNEPVNILKAIRTLADVACMVDLEQCHPVHYEYCLRYLSEVTGYSPVELENRL